MGIFENATHSSDYELLDKLGLKRFVGAPHAEWYDLGTVEDDWASVKVEVSCWPAQFYRFTIEPKEPDVQAGVIRTGSGSLSEYWPVVEKVINGCIVFEGPPAVDQEGDLLQCQG